MTLPPCDGTFAALPYRDAPYPATLNEIEAHFVDAAPESTRHRRALIMRALRLHVDIVTTLASKHGTAVRIFLDGGFITWKPKAPRDADLVVLVPLPRTRISCNHPYSRCGRCQRSVPHWGKAVGRCTRRFSGRASGSQTAT
ncbi:DUF6932 family protein [Mycolicibacter algericus]|uniref:Uncharacterized protein n=1 Tax=Mycolicibacter algericus TaxID=1288388 RepID=A0A7I9Y3V4_MYCAL|nr:hypothetical protein MALGJ_00250 [Mycolicibacter algericus]